VRWARGVSAVLSSSGGSQGGRESFSPQTAPQVALQSASKKTGDPFTPSSGRAPQLEMARCGKKTTNQAILGRHPVRAGWKPVPHPRQEPMSGRSRTFSTVAISFPGSAWESNARGSASMHQRHRPYHVGRVKRNRADAPEVSRASGASARLRSTHPTVTVVVSRTRDETVTHIDLSYWKRK